MADLLAEMKAGKRTHVKSPELDWARDYERSLIPPGVRFPIKGDVYEALEDVEVRYPQMDRQVFGENLRSHLEVVIV